ncbi:hypothetical protein FQR65_LT19253 [Abscondita terminalis]|nr:hypothetical protein FQR65_LT19253 [Abscondita terminalis]
MTVVPKSDSCIGENLHYYNAIITNGISPGLIGTLEGALGMIASDDLANSVLGMLPENLGDVLGGIGPTIEPILDLLSNSGIVYGLIANLLNINFINGISEGNTEVIMSSIMNLLPSLLNVIVKIVGNSFETMFNDFDGNPEDITNKMVINSAIIRLNNTLIDLIGDKGDQNLKENNLYISDDKEYKTFIDNKFNKAFSNLISNIDSLDLGGIISHISDLLFIIGAFVRTIGSVNFSDFSPKDSLHLYSNEKENKDIIKEIRNQKISNLDMSVVSNNLSIAFSNKDSNKNGLQLQKLINLLFFSESNKKELNDVGSVLGLLLYGINNGGFSPILNSLGLGLKSILNIPVIGDQIPKVLVILFDNLSNDYSMKFLNDILGSILPGLFTENDFSLKTEEVINSFNSNLKNYDLKLNKNISDGLKELGAHGGLSIKITSSTKADDFDETLTGRKAAMQALGMNYSNLNEFRENSLLSGLKKVVENPSIMNIFDQIIDGFTKTTNDKNDYSKEYFEPMINSSNFENILISNSKMNTELGEEKIVYETIFTDPISKKEFNYEIVLLLKENERI